MTTWQLVILLSFFPGHLCHTTHNTLIRPTSLLCAKLFPPNFQCPLMTHFRFFQVTRVTTVAWFKPDNFQSYLVMLLRFFQNAFVTKQTLHKGLCKTWQHKHGLKLVFSNFHDPLVILHCFFGPCVAEHYIYEGYCNFGQLQHSLNPIVFLEFPVPTTDIPLFSLNHLCFSTLYQGYCKIWQHQHALDMIVLFQFSAPTVTLQRFFEVTCVTIHVAKVVVSFEFSVALTILLQFWITFVTIHVTKAIVRRGNTNMVWAYYFVRFSVPINNSHY